MPKKVYLQPPFVMHACHNRLVAYPPSGYEFVVQETLQEKAFKLATSTDLPRSLLRALDSSVVPYNLFKAWLERRNKPPEGTVLTYASEHLVLRPEPWVVDMEFAHLLVGRHPKHLKRFKGVFERALASADCKRIICWSDAARATLADLDMRGFEHKIEVVRNSVQPRQFVKEYREDKVVKLFFIGTDALTTASWAFEGKGGREVLETFSRLRQRYSNVELVMRADAPADVKTKYKGMEGLRIIDRFIPWAELEHEYLTADIFIMPSHTTLFMTLLEAMSYELPVVTIDSWSNAEHVRDGKTGLVAPRSQKLPYFYPNTVQSNIGTPEYVKAMRPTDTVVIDELVKRVSMLIENPELRRQMGMAGRWEVEQGEFSLATMNGKLGRIFDEAIAADG